MNLGAILAKVNPVTENGGSEKIKARPRPEPEYKAVGILYCKSTKDILDFRVIYEGHISD